jgi:hypothetical protein
VRFMHLVGEESANGGKAPVLPSMLEQAERRFEEIRTQMVSRLIWPHPAKTASYVGPRSSSKNATAGSPFCLTLFASGPCGLAAFLKGSLYA